MMASPSVGDLDYVLDHEIETIVTAVDELGEVEIVRLERSIGAKAWGPGRFRQALRAAVQEGRVVRVNRRMVAPAATPD